MELSEDPSIFDFALTFRVSIAAVVEGIAHLEEPEGGGAGGGAKTPPSSRACSLSSASGS